MDDCVPKILAEIDGMLLCSECENQLEVDIYNKELGFYRVYPCAHCANKKGEDVMLRKHLSLLGMDCRDKVTGMEGVITVISFDLYGCIQAVVHPGLDEDGKIRDTLWFDISRLEITSKTPVMKVPDFDSGPIAKGRKGPALKPAMRKV